MQALYHNKVGNKIGNSKTVQTITKETYDKFSLEQHFKVKDKSKIPDYTSDKITNITYSSQERMADILGKLQKQAVLQKYHCMETAVAVTTELFNNSIVDVILKCCGIMLYYNHIPIMCLVNSDIGNNLVLTVDLYSVEEDINKRCQAVSTLVEKATREGICYSQQPESNNTLYIVGMLVLGICAITAILKQ